jgi:hypothetical protein
MPEKLYTTGDIARELNMNLSDVCYRVRRLIEAKKLVPIIKTPSSSLYSKEAIKLVADYGRAKQAIDEKIKKIK